LPHLEIILQLITDPCETKKKISKTSSHILVEKGSLPNRNSTSQKKENKKIHIACSNVYRKYFTKIYSSELEAQHRPIPLESSWKVSARSNGWIWTYAQ
jgi:hypothetical protein